MPKHISITNPPEILYRILSHLNIHDLVAVSQVSEWVRDVVNSLCLDYQILSIKQDVATPSFPKKIFIFTQQTSTYTELQKKLTLQAPHKKEWLQTIERVKQENDYSFDGTQVLKAVAGVGVVVSSPTLGGALLDWAKMGVSDVMFGVTGFDIGYGLSVLLLSGFCCWMFKMVYGSRDEMDYKSVQLIDEDSISIKLRMY